MFHACLSALKISQNLGSYGELSFMKLEFLFKPELKPSSAKFTNFYFLGMMLSHITLGS